MVNELHVSINLSKSLQSNVGVMEFAKRIIGPKGDFSPAGPKNIALALHDRLNLPSLFVDLMEKGLNIDYYSLLEFLSKSKEQSL